MSIVREGKPVILNPFLSKKESFSDFRFTFLNIEKDFRSVKREIPAIINWDCNDFGKLWNYNLNYMDYLLQPGIRGDICLYLMEQFIEKLPENKCALEPYTISLRTINWIKYLSYPRDPIPEKYLLSINHCLYAQIRILSKNIEYHILGNHLLENGFALLFGAFYFRDSGFWKTASDILMNELDEQILKDGAHFELTPTYHQILLDRMLDCINLVSNNVSFQGQELLLERMNAKAAMMVSWLKTVTYSSGSVPLFNDSAFNIAPETNDLLNYARIVGVPAYKPEIVLSESGLRIFRSRIFECVADIGPTGPDYQPGHSHADTFTFEFYVSGKPVIVDTGTSTYNSGERRMFERSTSAHNTVTISNANSSDVWSSHRVGRRAVVNSIVDHENRLSATHNGYKHFGYIIKREFLHDRKELKIIDTVQALKKESADRYKKTSRLHFHPGIKPVLKDKCILVGDLMKISFIGLDNIKFTDYTYSPEFNKQMDSQVAEIDFEDELTTIISIK